MTRTVAIVEDDAPIRNNYADAWRRRGYRVQTFATRDDAKGAFRSRPPDLVLLDIAPPDEIDAPVPERERVACAVWFLG